MASLSARYQFRADDSLPPAQPLSHSTQLPNDKQMPLRKNSASAVLSHTNVLHVKSRAYVGRDISLTIFEYLEERPRRENKFRFAKQTDCIVPLYFRG